MATGVFMSTANLPLYTNHGPESLVPKSLGQEGLLKSMEPPRSILAEIHQGWPLAKKAVLAQRKARVEITCDPHF